jgi:hypothetical protein
LSHLIRDFQKVHDRDLGAKKLGAWGVKELKKAMKLWKAYRIGQISQKQLNLAMRPQQIQDSGEMRASIRRQVYGCSLQKPQKNVDCSLVFRKISRKGRADKQSSGKGFAKACYLEKNFTGQQVSEWTDFCPEINDNYYFSWLAGPECNGIYRDHAQKFSGGFSPAKTELKSGCLSQHIHFSHSTVEMAKNFEQSNAYSNFWSCGNDTT